MVPRLLAWTTRPRQLGPTVPDIVTLGASRAPDFEHPPFRPGLLEACRDDHDQGDPLLAALLHHLWHMNGRHSDHGKVDRVWNGGDGRVRLEPLHFGALVVHRIDLAGEVEEVVQDGIPHLFLVGGGADDGDRPGGDVFGWDHFPLFPAYRPYLIYDSPGGHRGAPITGAWWLRMWLSIA